MLTYSYRSPRRSTTSVAATLQKKEYGTASTIQTKLTVGQPNDKYEQEADLVADQVVNTPASQAQGLQKKCSNCENEDKAQRASILQKAEEEEAQTKPSLMMTEEEETQPKLQKMEDEEPQTKLQMAEEEEVQAQEEEEPQTKKNESRATVAPSLVSRKIQERKGSGSPLPSSTRNFMESRIGADFSSVRVHTDSHAHQLNTKLNAQAFAVGNNLFFNKGKYNPETQSGKHLLAHELTHVVQQKPQLRMKSAQTPKVSNTAPKQISRWTQEGNKATVSKRGDTLAGLAQSITGNWRDWPGIWINHMHRADKSWGEDYYNWLEIGDTFDTSNLNATTGVSATIVFPGKDTFLKALKNLYGGETAIGFREQLADLADYGRTPIKELTLAGHSTPKEMVGRGSNINFVPIAHNPETPAPHGARSRNRNGPQRTWFTRNASVRMTGCTSTHIAQAFATNFLRKGAEVTGTNHWICGWRGNNGRYALSQDPSHCDWDLCKGTRHMTAASFHGEPGLWVTHQGQL